MAIRTSGEIRRATHIAMTWVVLSLAAAVAVGMVGRVYLTEPLTGTASETVFLVMTNELFPPIAAGLILSASSSRRRRSRRISTARSSTRTPSSQSSSGSPARACS